MGYRWPMMPDTGEAQVWGALGNVAAQIGNLGEQIEQIKVDNQLAAFATETARIDTELADALEREENSDRYEQLVAQ